MEELGHTLIESLGITPRSLVALVGGGGKTTLMRGLHAAALRRGWLAAAGTTTKVFAHQVQDIPVFLHRDRLEDKLTGLDPDSIDRSFETEGFDLLVIEADGSRSKVVKAPNATEPVIPRSANHVLCVMGADGINRVIEDVAHRPMLVAAVCGCGPYERLTPDRAARLLTSTRGGRQFVPESATFTVVLTRIGDRQRQAADDLATLLRLRGITTLGLPLIGDH